MKIMYNFFIFFSIGVITICIDGYFKLCKNKFSQVYDIATINFYIFQFLGRGFWFSAIINFDKLFKIFVFILAPL